jgi:L-lactate dehydrogenase
MKVGIVGCGLVGSTAAYAMVMQGVGREIVLVDKSTARAQAEADDIRHATPFSHALEIRSGSYADLAGAKVVVLCAGVAQKSGETRLQLLQRNAAVFREVVPAVLEVAPEAILVVATNPVDIMTHLAVQIAGKCGVGKGRVLGSGTTLDTARFRTLLAQHCGVDSHHVHAYVVGEHGDSEVLTWSLITIGGLPLDRFVATCGLSLPDSTRRDIDTQVRRAAYSIIQGKGATYYGIGSALSRIVKTVLHDQRSILTVCMPADSIAGVQNVTVAMPRLVGGEGVISTFEPLLSAEEQGSLQKSARVVRDALDSLEEGEVSR